MQYYFGYVNGSCLELPYLFLSDTISTKLYESLHLDLKIKMLYMYKLIKLNKMKKNSTTVFLF